MFEFQIIKYHKKARSGIFKTLHGNLHTPELSFVATEGEIKAIPKDTLKNLPVNLIIVNTFHIFTKDILKKIEDIGGIHKYAGYSKVVQSDSGGFQAFSLGFGKSQGVGKVANIFPGIGAKASDENNPLIIDENGVTFEFNGHKITLTPEKSMEIQHQIGADIIFAFDECTSPLNTKKYTANSLKRTHEWLARCLKKQLQLNQSKSAPNKSGSVKSVKQNTDSTGLTDSTDLTYKQALFGIVQGGYYEDLRKKSAKFLAKLDVPGYGIGGSLGKTKQDVWNVLEWTNSLLPEEKPRHLLGIGQVRDIFESVERGVDLFDCVIPTREARHKVLYTKKGKINVRKMRNVDEVADVNCQCQMCVNNLTMKQLNNLFIAKDPHAYYYSTVHNIYFYTNLLKEIRDSIELQKLDQLKEKYLKYY